MIESLLLVEGQNLREEVLASISLGNAKQLVIGRVPNGSIILHLAADAPDYLNVALIDLAQAPNVTKLLTLALLPSP